MNSQTLEIGATKIFNDVGKEMINHLFELKKEKGNRVSGFTLQGCSRYLGSKGQHGRLIYSLEGDFRLFFWGKNKKREKSEKEPGLLGDSRIGQEL